MEIDPEAIKSGFDMLRAVIESFKSAKDLLPSSPELEKVGEQIALAEREIQLAEAQIAQSLGYKLCKCQFPPVPMLKDRTDPDINVDVYKCSHCGDEKPNEASRADTKKRISERMTMSQIGAALNGRR